jgi:hypothetical protein
MLRDCSRAFSSEMPVFAVSSRAFMVMLMPQVPRRSLNYLLIYFRSGRKTSQKASMYHVSEGEGLHGAHAAKKSEKLTRKTKQKIRKTKRCDVSYAIAP